MIFKVGEHNISETAQPIYFKFKDNVLR